MKKNNNSNLTQDNQNDSNINNLWNNVKKKKKNHSVGCECNIHKQRDLYKKMKDYQIEYDKNKKPRGYLKKFEEYDINNYDCQT